MSIWREADPVARRTFRLELLRALPAGILETVLSVFAILILVKVFAAPDIYKSTLLSAGRIGLLAGVPAVFLVRRWRWRLSRAAAGLAVLSGSGFLFAALRPESVACYVAGLSGAFFFASLLPPLQTQILHSHYPPHLRGRLFALTAIPRAVFGALFGLLAGELLKRHLEWYPYLLGWFALLCFSTAWCFLAIPPASPGTDSHPPKPLSSILHAFVWLKRDRRFALLLLAWMFVGTGMLMALSVHVDYLANPEGGLGLDARQVTWLTLGIPVVFQLASALAWGAWFDRFSFPVVRLALNGVILAGILTVFLSPGITGIAAGLALFGVARGGGNVAWNLWVTKMAPPDHAAEYMSLHTFFTGIRGILAPWLGFALLRSAGPAGFALVAAALVVVSTVVTAAARGPGADGGPEKKAG